MTGAGAERQLRFARIETDLTVLKWMVGTVLVVVLAGFGVLFRMIGVG